MELAKMPAADKYSSEEVAQVLEDVLDAVEKDRNFIIGPGEIVNKMKLVNPAI